MTASDEDVLLVRVLSVDPTSGSPPVLEGPDAETQALRDMLRKKATALTEDIPVKVEDLRDSLQKMTDKLAIVFGEQVRPAEEAERGFALESFTVRLAVNAAGKVALVAEVGVEASVEVQFRRL